MIGMLIWHATLLSSLFDERHYSPDDYELPLRCRFRCDFAMCHDDDFIAKIQPLSWPIFAAITLMRWMVSSWNYNMKVDWFHYASFITCRLFRSPFFDARPQSHRPRFHSFTPRQIPSTFHAAWLNAYVTAFRSLLRLAFHFTATNSSYNSRWTSLDTHQWWMMVIDSRYFLSLLLLLLNIAHES